MRTDDNSHTTAVMRCLGNLRSDMCVEVLPACSTCTGLTPGLACVGSDGGVVPSSNRPESRTRPAPIASTQASDKVRRCVCECRSVQSLSYAGCVPWAAASRLVDRGADV